MSDCKVEKSVVQKGDCAWNVAKRNLANGSDKRISNADIIKEIKRLAELNGCSSIEDFSEKYFSKIGAEFVIDKVPVNRKVDSKARGVNSSRSTHKKPLTKEQEVDLINRMKDDTSRIVEYNKNNYSGNYYGIVDKKTCKLKIYNKSGKVVKTLTVGVGKTKGDDLGAYYLDHYHKTKDKAKAESHRYTTAGEFTLDDSNTAPAAYTGRDGKPKVMYLKGDNRGVRSGQMSIHMLYKPSYSQREKAIKSPGLEDNRMSYDCVNLTEEDFDVMHSFLGEGDKIYVLPEEKGNKLQLNKQKDGTYKFEQLFHKDTKRGVSKEAASAVKYDVRPDKKPKVHTTEKKSVDKQSVHKPQPKKQETKEFSWLNPMTWFG